MGGSYKTQVGRGGLDGSSGFLIRADGMPHRTTLPSWEKETQFRIFPAPKEGGGWHPARCSSEDNDFSLAIWSEPVTRRLGVHEQFTFITRIPGHQGESPTERFCNALIKMIEEKPRDVPEEWIQWPKGSRGQAAKLAKVRNCIFGQGMEIMRLGKMLVNAAGQPAPKFPALFMGPISLQIFFEQLANKRIEGTQLPTAAMIEAAKTDENARRQLDQAYATAFAIGDWCSLEGGRIVKMFQAPPGDSFQRPHYAIEMTDPLPLQGIESAIRSYWRPWDQLFRYHSAEEQVQLLSRAFPVEAVDFVFGHTELEAALPKSVKGAWRAWKSGQGAWAPGMAPTGAPVPGLPPAVAGAQTGRYPAGAPNVAAAGGQIPGVPLQAALPAAAAVPAVAPAVPAAPAASAVAPAVPTTQAGGVQFDLSGGGEVPGEAADQPVMSGGAFAQTPAAFAAPVAGAPPGATPVAPAAPATGAAPAGTSGQIPGEPDAAKLNAALTDLQKGRDQAGGGNLGG